MKYVKGGRLDMTKVPFPAYPTLETTWGQIDGLFSQFPFKFYLPEVASVGDRLEICPRGTPA